LALPLSMIVSFGQPGVLLPMSKKNLLQWLPLTAFAIIMLTDLRPVVLGGMQRALLATGLWSAPMPLAPAGPVVVATGAILYPHSLVLRTPDGRQLRLSELRGKAVFVNLWASWCPPCVAELPGIEALYQKTDSTKVAFVMISLDENPARAQALLRRRRYTFPTYFPTGPLRAPFDSPSIPSTVILAPDGQVASRHDGMADYDTPEFKAALEQLATPATR
jgi:thiol-disulfide isomerase/thioredoxin